MEQRHGLNRDMLKYMAITAMLLDHIAWYLLPFGTPAAQTFHVVGRITAPVMCYFAAQGYVYTRSLPRYLGRLLIFAAISQAPWYFLHRDSQTPSFNFLLTLVFCLLTIHAWESIENLPLRVLAVVACTAATWYCDWHIYAPLWCLFFYVFRGDRGKQLLSFTLVALFYIEEAIRTRMAAGYGTLGALKGAAFTLGVFLAIPLFLLYNEKKGRFSWSKWVFYVFYPLHLAVIAILVALIR